MADDNHPIAQGWRYVLALKAGRKAEARRVRPPQN
jgi:hypothetical protein